MKTILRTAFLCLFLTFSVTANALETTTNAAKPEMITARVTKVHDGDTIAFPYKGKVVSGRLLGIDAPELKQPMGKEAQKALSGIVLGKPVDIEIHGNDYYGRPLIRISGVNRQMVMYGYAWSLDESYDKYQAKAREERRGLWAIENPESPREYRVRIKEERKIQTCRELLKDELK